MRIMNKPLKLVIILSLISLAFLVLIIFISDIKVADIPLWATIGMPTLLLATPFIFFLVQRSTQRVLKDATLQKRRKRLLISSGAYIVFMAILLVIIQRVSPNVFWVHLLTQIALVLSMFFTDFRIFFPKKEDTKDDNQKE